MKCVCLLLLFSSIGLWAQSAGLAGEWDGVLAGKLRVVFKLEKTADDSWRGALVSPDQGNAVVPMDAVTFDGKSAVHVEWKKLGATFDGELRADGSELSGRWQQGAATLPLTLRRAGSAPVGPTKATLKPATRGRVALQPCLALDGETQALCATYDVFENRETKSGRKISLTVMMLPAQSEQPARDAVLGFAGGPGQSAVKTLPFLDFLRTLQKQHDIVLIDQRGTGKSNPLVCPVPPTDLQTLISRPYSVETLPACRTELETHADLTQYTTANGVDDADEVREAMGYAKVDVVGASYGSQAALAYLKRHGDHVRAMAISGVVPLDYLMPLPFAKTVQSALQALFRSCAADAACHTDYPKLKEEFETIVQRLDRGPATIEVALPGTSPTKVTLSRGMFVSALRPLLYEPTIVSQLPYVIDRAYQNDWSLFAALSIGMHRAISGDLARGMAFSVSCSESTPFLTEAKIKQATAGTYLGDFDVRVYQKACAAWPKGAAAKDSLTPVRSDVPVLLIAGERDPATPASLARHVAESLKNSTVIAIPDGTHATGSACLDRLQAQFIEDASAKSLDLTCVAQTHFPPYMTLQQVQALKARSSSK